MRKLSIYVVFIIVWTALLACPVFAGQARGQAGSYEAWFNFKTNKVDQVIRGSITDYTDYIPPIPATQETYRNSIKLGYSPGMAALRAYHVLTTVWYIEAEKEKVGRRSKQRTK